MSTIVLETAQAQGVPYTYVLPGAQTIRPESAFAHWDGSGASGDFLACLTFKAQDGKIFSRTFPSTPIAAGGEADVSYAPFPGGIGQPAAQAATWQTLFSDPLTLTAGTFGNFVWQANAGSTLVDLTDPTNPTLLTSGIYILSVDCLIPAAPAPPGTPVRFDMGGGAVFQTTTAFLEGGGAVGPSGVALAWAGFLPAGQGIATQVVNDSAATTFAFENQGYSIVKL